MLFTADGVVFTVDGVVDGQAELLALALGVAEADEEAEADAVTDAVADADAEPLEPPRSEVMMLGTLVPPVEVALADADALAESVAAAAWAAGTASSDDSGGTLNPAVAVDEAVGLADADPDAVADGVAEGDVDAVPVAEADADAEALEPPKIEVMMLGTLTPPALLVVLDGVAEALGQAEVAAALTYPRGLVPPSALAAPTTLTASAALAVTTRAAARSPLELVPDTASPCLMPTTVGRTKANQDRAVRMPLPPANPG